jgi:hypothetical protein
MERSAVSFPVTASLLTHEDGRSGALFVEGRHGANRFNYAGTQTVEQGAREPVRLALLGPDGPTGTFSNADGMIPW